MISEDAIVMHFLLDFRLIDSRKRDLLDAGHALSLVRLLEDQ